MAVWSKCLNIAFITFTFLIHATARADQRQITGVAVSADSFNPSLKQTVALTVSVASAGTVDATVLDRDGFPVRRLPSLAATRPGRVEFRWDGRDSAGELVPDEAYSFKVDFAGGSGRDTYFPANAAGAMVELRVEMYDRDGGILRYTLPRASRVHIQGGVAKTDAVTRSAEGPVLKTIVNREPRVAGAIVEHWRGYDESGSVYVPDLPNFVIAIAATPLPENSVIATGNRSRSFVDSALKRTGRSLISSTVESHHHHQGLQVFDDVSPSLQLQVTNARWSNSQRSWTTSASRARIGLRLDGPSAANFSRHPGRIVAFVDGRKVLERQAKNTRGFIEVPLDRHTSHVVAVNWVSAYGPVAANSFRIDTATTAEPGR